MKINVNSQAFKLSGIMLKGAYYDAKYWHDLCGVNPLNYPQYFTVNSFGKVYAKELFHKHYKARSNSIHDNWSAIGVSN